MTSQSKKPTLPNIITTDFGATLSSVEATIDPTLPTLPETDLYGPTYPVRFTASPEPIGRKPHWRPPSLHPPDVFMMAPPASVEQYNRWSRLLKGDTRSTALKSPSDSIVPEFSRHRRTWSDGYDVGLPYDPRMHRFEGERREFENTYKYGSKTDANISQQDTLISRADTNLSQPDTLVPEKDTLLSQLDTHISAEDKDKSLGDPQRSEVGKDLAGSSFPRRKSWWDEQEFSPDTIFPPPLRPPSPRSGSSLPSPVSPRTPDQIKQWKNRQIIVASDGQEYSIPIFNEYDVSSKQKEHARPITERDKSFEYDTVIFVYNEESGKYTRGWTVIKDRELWVDPDAKSKSDPSSPASPSSNRFEGSERRIHPIGKAPERRRSIADVLASADGSVGELGIQPGPRNNIDSNLSGRTAALSVSSFGGSTLVASDLGSTSNLSRRSMFSLSDKPKKPTDKQKTSFNTEETPRDERKQKAFMEIVKSAIPRSTRLYAGTPSPYIDPETNKPITQDKFSYDLKTYKKRYLMAVDDSKTGKRTYIPMDDIPVLSVQEQESQSQDAQTQDREDAQSCIEGQEDVLVIRPISHDPLTGHFAENEEHNIQERLRRATSIMLKDTDDSLFG